MEQVHECERAPVGTIVVGATVVGTAVAGTTVVGTTVVGTAVVGPAVVGTTVVGTSVVGTIVGVDAVGAWVGVSGENAFKSMRVNRTRLKSFVDQFGAAGSVRACERLCACA